MSVASQDMDQIGGDIVDGIESDKECEFPTINNCIAQLTIFSKTLLVIAMIYFSVPSNLEQDDIPKENKSLRRKLMRCCRQEVPTGLNSEAHEESPPNKKSSTISPNATTLINYVPSEKQKKNIKSIISEGRKKPKREEQSKVSQSIFIDDNDNETAANTFMSGSKISCYENNTNTDKEIYPGKSKPLVPISDINSCQMPAFLPPSQLIDNYGQHYYSNSTMNALVEPFQSQAIDHNVAAENPNTSLVYSHDNSLLDIPNVSYDPVDIYELKSNPEALKKYYVTTPPPNIQTESRRMSLTNG